MSNNYSFSNNLNKVTQKTNRIICTQAFGNMVVSLEIISESILFNASSETSQNLENSISNSQLPEIATTQTTDTFIEYQNNVRKEPLFTRDNSDSQEIFENCILVGNNVIKAEKLRVIYPDGNSRVFENCILEKNVVVKAKKLTETYTNGLKEFFENFTFDGKDVVKADRLKTITPAKSSISNDNTSGPVHTERSINSDSTASKNAAASNKPLNDKDIYIFEFFIRDKKNNLTKAKKLAVKYSDGTKEFFENFTSDRNNIIKAEKLKRTYPDNFEEIFEKCILKEYMLVRAKRLTQGYPPISLDIFECCFFIEQNNEIQARKLEKYLHGKIVRRYDYCTVKDNIVVRAGKSIKYLDSIPEEDC